MSTAERRAFEELIYSYVGRSVCERRAAKDAVNEAMIRHWAEAMGDRNPAYTDSRWAARSHRGRIVAPPAMLYCWNQEGFPAVARGRTPDAQTELVELFDEHGYTGVLGTNVRQEYLGEIGLGDTLHMEMRIDNISGRKTTGRGAGYFFETLATFTSQRGDGIGSQRFRVLKFIPPERPAERA